jgi:hypothetical protein
MSALPSSAVTIGYGEITITADLLALKLGLSVEVLKAEMRRDYIYSVIEQGMDETPERASPSAIALIRRRGLDQPAVGLDHHSSRALMLPNTVHQVTEALEHLMAEDAATDRPFIAAIAISKERGGLPAPGFFDCARRLGRCAGDEVGPEAWAFHAREFNAAVSFWAAAATTGKSG